MRAFVALCLARPITTATVHITLIVMGAIALTRLPLNSHPESERPRIRVEIPMPGAHPLQVEQEVTRKVEEALATLRGIRRLSSESSASEASVRAEFDHGVNLDQVKLEVRERLARIRHELPVDDIERIRIRGAWGSGEAILQGRISAHGIDLSRNYELLVNRLRRPLERIEGVAQVEMDGVTPLEIQVTFRHDDLARHGLQARQLMTRLEQNNVDQTIAEVHEDGVLRRVRLVNAFGGIDEVRAFPVDEHGLRLDQVATVELQQGELRWGRHLNRRFAVSLEVFKESTANTVEVCERVLDRIEELKSDPQLAGIDLLVWENQGRTILEALAGLRDAGLLGGALALAILFVFLRRVSATALVGLSIPISVLAALAWLYLLGRDLNVLTIVALMLGVGMLVDTAVVVVESIARLNDEGLSAREAAQRGTLEVATPVFAATLTTIIVFLPVAFGEPGRLTDRIAEMGLVISLTLGAALFVSLTLVPMAAARIYRPGVRDAGGWFAPVRAAYARVLAAALRRPAVTLALAAAVCASAFVPLRLGLRLELSDVSEQAQNVSVFYTPVASLDWQAMERHVDAVEQVLLAHQDELDFSDIYSWYKDGFAWTAIYPRERTLGEAQLAAVRARVDALLPAIPDVRVRTGDWGMFWGGGGAARSAGSLHVRVFGDSFERVTTLLDALAPRLAAQPGVAGVERQLRDAVQELRVEPDDERLARLRLSPQEVAREVQAGFSDTFLREIRHREGQLRLRVALDEREKDSLAELHALRIASRNAQAPPLPLAALGRIEEAPAPREVHRENRQSSAMLSVTLAPGYEITARRAVEQTLAATEWPRGYSYDLGDAWNQRDENRSTLVLSLLLAVFLVYLVMACLFESLVQPLLLMMTVVLALPGVLWFLYACGDTVDLPAGIGLILLVGIVVNNGIVMIDHMNRYRAAGGDALTAVLRGGQERLRPVLITALTTIIGLVPLAFGGADAAGVHYYTLARTIMGGLAASTLLTLFVLPLGVYLLYRAQAWLRERPSFA